MKRFMVTDDQGNPVYADSHFDVDRVRLLCLPFATTQDIMQQYFGERFTAMRCEDNWRFVFTQYDNLFFIVVTDEGESVPFLKRQLQLIYELLQLKFGHKPDLRLHQHRVSARAGVALRPLIYTMTSLSSSQQSYLVQSIERLEVNDDLRAKCMRSLEEAWQSQRGHGAAHVLLFVGTKLLVNFSRPRAFELSPSDIFLLTLYIKSLQDPPPPVTQTPMAPDAEVLPKLSGSDEEFVLAREDVDDNDLNEPAARRSLDSDSASYTSKEDETQQAQELSVFDTLHFRAPNYTPYFVYFGQVAPLTTMVVISDSMSGTERERQMMMGMQNSIRRSLVNFIDFLIIKEQTHMTVLSFLSHFPGLVHFIFVDRLNHQVIAPVIIPLDNDNDLNVPQDTQSNAGADDKKDASASASMLKRKIWEMVFNAQDRLSQGYTSMIMQAGGFQFSYHLWFEDPDGNGLPLDQPMPTPEHSFDGAYYRDAARKLFPGIRQVNCFELYTLHLASVPSRTLIAQNRRLVKKLREGRSRLFQVPRFTA